MGDAQENAASTPERTRDAISLGRIAALSSAAFAALWAFQSIAAYSALRTGGGEGGAGAFISVLGANFHYYPPWVLFSTLFVRVLDRRRERLSDSRTVGGLFLAGALLFYVPYVAYEALVSLLWEGGSLSQFPERLRNWPPFFFFVDFILYAGCFASLYAFGVARGQILRDRSRQMLESQNLALRLQLERQRLASIQAQLEPHFLFNALNAISALVRREDRSTALSALTQLSGLLRYALTASRADRVTLREELGFIRDYLDLQQLRYGARLCVRMDIEDETLGDLECPPLLLQPLIENALRHDLDAHDGTSDLELRIAHNGEGALVTISNPLREGPSPNAGFGLGLGTTRARLALRYGESARLTTADRDGRFVVELLLPEHAVA